MSVSKLRGSSATFFIFIDYARPAIRLSAIMELPTLFVFSHDAMGDGEDARLTNASSTWLLARNSRARRAPAR